MKKRIRTAFSLVAVLLLLSNQAIEIRGDGWLKSFEEAERRAEETGQPILIHFGAWYCGPCRQMEQNVFSDPSIDRRLQDGLISVKIDITRDEATAQRFGATTVPRDVVIYPDKTYETLGVGSVSRASYHSLLDRIVATGRRMNVVQAPAANPTNNSSSPEVPYPPGTADGGAPDIVRQEIARRKENSDETAEASAPVEEKLLGLDGFCPVELYRRRIWETGTKELTATFRGVEYRFSSASARQQFSLNPARYAPQNLGCDPVLLTEKQRAVTGKIQFGAFFDNRLYLFRSEANKERFRAEPLKYSVIRSAIRVDEIQGSRFR